MNPQTLLVIPSCKSLLLLSLQLTQLPDGLDIVTDILHADIHTFNFYSCLRHFTYEKMIKYLLNWLLLTMTYTLHIFRDFS